MEQFGCLPSVESAFEVSLWAENAELLKLMVCMVEDNFVTKELLLLTKEPGSKAWLLFEVGDMKTPLVLEERFNVLVKGWWKALGAEPFFERQLEK